MLLYTYLGLHLNRLLFLSNFNRKSEMFRQMAVRISNVKFHENPLSGSRVVSRRMDLSQSW
jgi:hypothetical protein